MRVSLQAMTSACDSAQSIFRRTYHPIFALVENQCGQRRPHFQGQGVMDNKGEPRSRRLSPRFPMLIGKNSRGQWVARSQDGLSGGLFVNRTEALRYALFENGRRPEAVVIVSGGLELALTQPVNVLAYEVSEATKYEISGVLAEILRPNVAVPYPTAKKARRKSIYAEALTQR
jgi:hypothetical protein